MLAAARYICAVGSGVTKPAFFEGSDGRIYVVKLARKTSDYNWLLSELLAAEIGRRLKLPFPPAQPIYIDNASFGCQLPVTVHFASLYIENASYLDWQKLPTITNLPQVIGMILFDSFFFNDDRIKRNRNLLLTTQGEQSLLLGIDHSHLFGTLHWNQHHLKALATVVPDYDLTLWRRLLVGYKPAEALAYYSQQLAQLLTEQKEALLAALPAEWLPENEKIRPQLADFLAKRQTILPLLIRYLNDSLLAQPSG